MSDLSQLSDEGLLNLYKAQKPGLSAMSDADLKAAYAQSRGEAAKSADQNLGGTLRIGPWDTGIGLPPAVEAGIVGAGKSATRIMQGVQQAGNAIMGRDSTALDNQVADENKRYQPLADAHPIATSVGEAVPSLAVPVGAAGSALGAVGRMALAGAVPGALEYGTGQEKAIRAGLGAAGGAVGGAAGLAAGRVLNPIRSAGVDEATQAAGKYGIDLTPGQATGSPVLKYAESALANLPGSAGRMGDIAANHRAALNRGVMGAMGAEGDKVTPEAVEAGKSALGQVFNTVPKSVTVKVDDTLLNNLGDVEAKYTKNLSPDQRPIVSQYIDDILAHGENIPGDSYQAWRSRISARANSTQDSELKSALTGVYQSLDAAFDRSASPEAADAMKTVRGQYSAAKTIEKLANNTGDVSAARLGNLKLAKGDLGELSRLAPMLKGLPDSGTAQRSWWMNLLSEPITKSLSPGSILGATGVPWAAANAMTRDLPFGIPGGKSYLTRGLLNVSPEIERRLARIGSVPGIAATGLLGQQ